MNRTALISELKSNHQAFIEYLDALGKDKFEFRKGQKWTAGQEMDHIIKSTLPLSQILNSKALLASKFGKIDRNPVSYDELVDLYHKELEKGGKAFGQYLPDEISWGQKDEMTNQLSEIVESIIGALDNYSDKELTEFFLPHPLIGKLTVLEMLYFAIYHVQHHRDNIRRNLA